MCDTAGGLTCVFVDLEEPLWIPSGDGIRHATSQSFISIISCELLHAHPGGGVLRNARLVHGGVGLGDVVVGVRHTYVDVRVGHPGDRATVTYAGGQPVLRHGLTVKDARSGDHSCKRQTKIT